MTMRAVSIILPTFNRTNYLRAAIDSVFAQTFADWEMIIVDDGSADETKQFLRGIADPRVRTIWLPHSGNPSLVRNTGIRSAGGRYLAFLDSDDIWIATKLEMQIAAMRERPDRRWSCTHCALIDDKGFPIVNHDLASQVPADGWILESLLTLKAQIAMAAVVAQRDLVGEIGGFDECLLFGEYLDLCVRLAMRSEVASLADPLCLVRVHTESYSADRVAEYEGWLQFYGKMATLVPDPRLRTICRRIRADKSIVLAGLYADRTNYRASWRSMANAARFSWMFPRWWLGAAKTMVRPLVRH
jgi:glycosyltransferase involved in cell wall biosynthesis